MTAHRGTIIMVENKQEAQLTTAKFKDTLFRTLFNDSINFLELYNAVTNENHPVNTIVKPCPANELIASFNDLAACIGNQLIVFFEHQSTSSINMPLRLLSYVTDILRLHIVDKADLFGKKQVMIPTPKFFVLYNGTENLKKTVLKLSDAFLLQESEPAMELTAKIIDINLNNGDPALNRSITLQGYSYLNEEIRKNIITGMTRDMAIATSINLCIKQNILAEFLIRPLQRGTRYA